MPWVVARVALGFLCSPISFAGIIYSLHANQSQTYWRNVACCTEWCKDMMKDCRLQLSRSRQRSRRWLSRWLNSWDSNASSMLKAGSEEAYLFLQRHSGNLENGSELVRKALSQRLIWSWILRKRCVWRSTVVVAVVVVAVADLSLLLIAILMVSDRSCWCCLSLRPLFWCRFCWMMAGSLLGDEFKVLLYIVVQDRALRSEVHFERDSYEADSWGRKGVIVRPAGKQWLS